MKSSLEIEQCCNSLAVKHIISTSLLGENSNSRLQSAEDATVNILSEASCRSFIIGFHTAVSWKLVRSCCTERERLWRHFTAANLTLVLGSSRPDTTWSIVHSMSIICNEKFSRFENEGLKNLRENPEGWKWLLRKEKDPRKRRPPSLRTVPTVVTVHPLFRSAPLEMVWATQVS